MDKVLLQKLANRIKELRKLHKYTQDDLADLAQIARSTKIAKAFNLTLAEFLNF